MYFCGVNTYATLMLHTYYFHGAAHQANRLIFYPFNFFVK